MLTLKSSSACVVRPRAAVRGTPVRPVRSVAVRSTPQEIDAKLAKAIKDAENCNDKDKGCAPLWDEVEELSAAKSHLKDAVKADPAQSDPLEAFCKDAPDADECRVYED
mmetsp:Transcript_6972/g.15354  ORF Transcript_6972/g.15354 Transcript_6972/m.15354 type:complete len:109 (+) Transcript_6972:133-459(+)|eukprot:CAMPEP_0202905580 /NCGR_PEP_ID=MMETSP1392-20130828/34984_1 /ASSEMBLY_ACC=CAM_ASM_000868 /TAXON_ID=225041 /ORGANISM="Chlamydomonas chlamydogama, Strain SAG 11-48b" /LENGTH=108 /DNA_ID=CAMNT_0049593735 /DNA_START=91 /DNA_END=417 /DNA_ORIENTATION=+